MPNSDAYQTLAYCTALGLPRGFLVYAKDSGERPRSHNVLSSGCIIEVRTLDVEGGVTAATEHSGCFASVADR